MNSLSSKKANQEKLRMPVFVFLGVIALFTAGMGVAQVRSSINKPQDTFRGDDAAVQAAAVQNVTQQLNRQEQDTDNDGLSDSDELNYYGTSPYLPDTDSDGFDDGQEIASGHDPNCPTGQSCRAQEVTVEDQELLDQFGELAETPEPAEAPLVDLLNLSIEEIRAIILETGEVSAEELSTISDDDLRIIYQQAIGASDIQ